MKYSEMSIGQLERISDLLGIELSDLFDDEKSEMVREKILKLKIDINRFKLNQEDLIAISQFQKIVKNYIKMSELL